MVNRKQWFFDRIGKTIYRNKTTCPCSVCGDVYKNGLLVGDKFNAEYLNDVEGEYNANGETLKYFDTIKERDEFENNLDVTMEELID